MYVSLYKSTWYTSTIRKTPKKKNRARQGRTASRRLQEKPLEAMLLGFLGIRWDGENIISIGWWIKISWLDGWYDELSTYPSVEFFVR